MGRPKKNPFSAPSALPKKIGLLPEFFDVNTSTDPYWEALLKRFSKTARVYGFSRLEVPFLEDFRLYEAFYSASPGKASVVPTLDYGAVTAALRPSHLPGVLRHFHKQKLHDTENIYKWHYGGYIVLKDSAGAIRPDFEFGWEILGNFNHLNVAQVISAAWEFLDSLGLENLILEINNLGSQECQATYSGVLTDALISKKYELCENCSENLGTRPLVILTCKNLGCQALLVEAPTALDFLDQDSHKSFTLVLEALDEMNIPYQLNAFYAGTEVYEQVNFSIKAKFNDTLVSLAEGGEHAGLARNICGQAFPAFGVCGSLKRLRHLMEENNIEATRSLFSEVCLVPLGELAAKRSLRLFRDLTAEKIIVYDHFGLSGIKNQLKMAQEQKVPIALIMGQKEAMDEMVILRDVKSGMQEIISYDKIIEEVKKRLGK